MDAVLTIAAAWAGLLFVIMLPFVAAVILHLRAERSRPSGPECETIPHHVDQDNPER